MKSVISMNSRIERMKEEVGAQGWLGMAWACLRRNPKYKSAVRHFRSGRTRARDVCVEFGIRRVQDDSQSFEQGIAPEFKPVRIVRRCDQIAVDPTLSVRQNRVRFKPTQVAVVISLDQDIGVQLQLAERALERAKARLDVCGKAMRNLRPFSVMVDLVANALVAYELSVQGWGPSRIGALLF